MKKMAADFGRRNLKKKEPIGAHWKQTDAPLLYQLYRRVERVASKLERRRRRGHVATKKYIDELNDISRELRVLDRMKLR